MSSCSNVAHVNIIVDQNKMAALKKEYFSNLNENLNNSVENKITDTSC